MLYQKKLIQRFTATISILSMLFIFSACSSNSTSSAQTKNIEGFLTAYYTADQGFDFATSSEESFLVFFEELTNKVSPYLTKDALADLQRYLIIQPSTVADSINATLQATKVTVSSARELKENAANNYYPYEVVVTATYADGTTKDFTLTGECGVAKDDSENLIAVFSPSTMDLSSVFTAR